MKRCRSCGTVWDSKKKDCPECGGVNVDNQYIRSPLEDQFREKRWISNNKKWPKGT
jgi:rRNA maturation endonuclease Nob1